jgi:hypothetical protein
MFFGLRHSRDAEIVVAISKTLGVKSFINVDKKNISNIKRITQKIQHKKHKNLP